jgi:hypothetical protein
MRGDSLDADPILQVGVRTQVDGRYIAHWEWTRFEIIRRRRGLGHRRVLCELLPADGVAADPLAVLDMARPDNWRQQPGLLFDVTADVVALEKGNFGHKGTLHWRLQVLRWIEVSFIE